MTTWRKELEYERERIGDDTPIVHVAPDETVLDIEFDGDFGLPFGKPVLVWSERFVYFPHCYDGAEDMASAPRDPRDEPMEHVGGW